MTPREEAISLVIRFRKEAKLPSKHFDKAKQCALICVDEIINDEYFCNENSCDSSKFERTEYWQEVKEEINKL